MHTIEIKNDWCKGCYICIEFCPKGVLEKDKSSLVRGFYPVIVARPEECTACRQCELLCPDLAIAIHELND
jgi:2-oxoglutarate ferredoxin oxidoreductase subunit delta